MVKVLKVILSPSFIRLLIFFFFLLIYGIIFFILKLLKLLKLQSIFVCVCNILAVL